MCFIAAAGKVINREADVSFWRLADMPNAPLNVCLEGQSGDRTDAPQGPLMMLWTAPTLRHQSAKGWLREANHVEGSRPWARLARLGLILRSQCFRCTGSMTLA